MRLVKTRLCDSACCLESPRFPTRDGKSCIYLKAGFFTDEIQRCELMTGKKKLSPNVVSVPFNNLSAQEVFQETCVEWPQKNSLPEEGNTGGCCWQWIDE